MRRADRLAYVADCHRAVPDAAPIARALGCSPQAVRRDLRDLRERGALPLTNERSDEP